MIAPALSAGEDPVLDITVERGADGKSRLIRHRVSYPWSLGRAYPTRSRSGAITIIPQAAGAGLLAGDSLRQRIVVAPGASLRIAPAGATLVHGAPSSRAGRSSWRHALEGSARVSIASEPYVLMEDAHLVLRQDLVVDVAACLVATEAVVVAPGVSRASWMLETRAMRPDGTRIFDDVQVANTCSLRRIGRLPAYCTAFASVLIFAPSQLLEGLRHDLEHLIARGGTAVWAGCAPLRADAGLGIRLAGREGGRIRTLSRELHDFSAMFLGI